MRLTREPASGPLRKFCSLLPRGFYVPAVKLGLWKLHLPSPSEITLFCPANGQMSLLLPRTLHKGHKSTPRSSGPSSPLQIILPHQNHRLPSIQYFLRSFTLIPLLCYYSQAITTQTFHSFTKLPFESIPRTPSSCFSLPSPVALCSWPCPCLFPLRLQCPMPMRRRLSSLLRTSIFSRSNLLTLPPMREMADTLAFTRAKVCLQSLTVSWLSLIFNCRERLTVLCPPTQKIWHQGVIETWIPKIRLWRCPQRNLVNGTG